MRVVLTLLAAALLTSCVRSSVLPLAADTIQITTSAAPVCGAAGAQSVALQRAAIETVNRGFDRFMIVGAGAQNNVRVIGTTPLQANTYGTATATQYGNTISAQGQSTTYVTGGQPIIGGSHDQELVVKMFRDGDPLGQNAISARATLGPEWQKLVMGTARTC